MTIIKIAKTSENKDVLMYGNKLNRHGIIAGATGTGKTISLKVLTEQFSKAGIPVFLADIKGDLATLAKAGSLEGKVAERVSSMGLEGFTNQAFPVRLWDVFQEKGHPIRATISEMGPLLLSRLLELNETQTGVLNIAFRVADDKKLLLIDMKDLKAMLNDLAENASTYSTQYGNITKQSIGAIQRSLLTLEDQGGDDFFGEPAIDLNDFMQVDQDGKGFINILMAQKLFGSPKLYSTFLLWMLTELFEMLPEVGDLDKPKMIFFFDEAHLLFNDTPKAFIERVEQVVRLIRSKGVGIYFVTQNPVDIPENILGQLGNRIQHALRAYTPKEIKAVKLAATTFRPNPNLDTAAALTELKVGEALISCLNEEGQPEIVERASVIPPESFIGAVDESEYTALINKSPMESKYRTSFDRESAYEILSNKVAQQEIQTEKETTQAETRRIEEYKETPRRSPGRPAKSALEKNVDTVIKTATSTIGREIIRGLFGILKKR
ncbi:MULTISPECIES: helicase HerA-like domain-containing protein [unclassified Gemella]|uniref:helicase HerA-like domain-containing protein n=1 Tax=unclassified Gemella TaxID=2624949 RepID=UPI0015D0A75C|nr:MULTISPECIES: helicase HerA-like domain-containing protein [unclassified Gemella]MBF0709951.1 DUF853 family protein [Gemella sp. GL1.1]NYS27295.1 DUF853 family protein [Gemella sp. GL1]